MLRTLIKLRHDRLKAETQESNIHGTVESIAFNMSLLKRVNPEFYNGIQKIANEVPYFVVSKQKEETKKEENNEDESNRKAD